MIYVSLSRVQRLEQLYILGELPESKMKPWQDAKEEMERLNEKDQSTREKHTFKLSSMNICSLQAHFEDLIEDEDMMSSQVICLQETWLHPNVNDDGFSLPGRHKSINSVRKGAGIVTYYSTEFQEQKQNSITATYYQISSITSNDRTVINIYRSSDSNDEGLLTHLERIISAKNEKDVYICGDFNLCHIEDKNHSIFQLFQDHSFSITRNPLTGTHKRGRCLDTIWYRGTREATSQTKFVYYSDHAQQIVKLNDTADDQSAKNSSEEKN